MPWCCACYSPGESSVSHNDLGLEAETRAVHDGSIQARREAPALEGDFDRQVSAAESEALVFGSLEEPQALQPQRSNSQSSSASSAESEVWETFTVVGTLEPEHRDTLHDTFEAELEPESNEEEPAPRVNVLFSKYHDYFEMTTKKRKMRKVPEETIHHRRPSHTPITPKAIKALLAGTGQQFLDGDLCWESTGSLSNKSEKALQLRKGPSGDVEHVTKWGVLLGKLFRKKVFGSSLAVRALANSSKKVNPHGERLGSSLLSSVQRRAQKALEVLKELAGRIRAEEHDCLDEEWHDEDVLELLFGSKNDAADTLMLLATVARKLLSQQPIVAEVTAPCRIFGDIHGQLRDLLLFLAVYGFPSATGPHFIFNGDFVDRGTHQLEVLATLLFLKVAFPEKVWLNRGNHEDTVMNEKYGFRDACISGLGESYGSKLYEMFHKAFDQLPIACLIEKRILVVHGGVGDGTWDLDDLRCVPRPLDSQKLNSPEMLWLWNILWSDPVEDDTDQEVLPAEQSSGVFGVHQSPRSASALQFAWNVTQTFCARNGIELLVRSHQSKERSPGWDVMHESKLARIFTARDYEGHGNDGAVLLVAFERTGHGEAVNLLVKPQVIQSVAKAQRTLERGRSKARKPSIGAPSPL